MSSITCIMCICTKLNLRGGRRGILHACSAFIEISYTQDFQILFSKGHNSEKGHASFKSYKKVTTRRTYISTHAHTYTHTVTQRQAKSNMPYLPFQLSKVGGIISFLIIKISSHADNKHEISLSRLFKSHQML